MPGYSEARDDDHRLARWMTHPVSQQDAAGGETKTTYSNRGFATVTDPLAGPRPTPYDKRGNVTRSLAPATRTRGAWRFGVLPTTMVIAYDATYGVPTSIIDYRGPRTTFTLDVSSRGNVLRAALTPMGCTRTGPNTAGQVLTATDRIERHHDLHL